MSGVPSWAVKGAKVVCVDAGWDTESPVLSEGAVYEIERVFANNGPASDRYATVPWVVILRGVRNPHAQLHHEGAFALDRFRPPVTRTQEQDIAEHFSGFLHGRVPEGVDA